VALAEAKEVLGVKKLLLNAHGYVLSVPSEIIIYVLAKVGAGETATLNAEDALPGLAAVTHGSQVIPCEGSHGHWVIGPGKGLHLADGMVIYDDG
jgi:hypothetical protein